MNTNRLERLQVVQGRWYIKVTGDYLGLVQGRIYRDEGNDVLQVLPTLPEWSSCSSNAFKEEEEEGAGDAAGGASGGRRRLTTVSSHSLKFLGTETSHPTVSYNALLVPSTSKLTFEAWIKPTTASPTSFQYLAQLGAGGWGVFITAAGTASGTCTGSVKTALLIGYFATSCTASTYSNTAVTANAWTHVAVTVDTSLSTDQVKIYFNGVDKTDAATSPNTGAAISLATSTRCACGALLYPQQPSCSGSLGSSGL